MVYLHFPSNYTEEELVLQNKYEKLKRKKKALQQLKAPKPEPERIIPKRPHLEGRDAREIAKKLLKSGAIAAIQKPQRRDEQAGFKRPCGLERKLERTISGYQPFSTNQDEFDIESRPRVKAWYDASSTRRDTESSDPADRTADPSRPGPHSATDVKVGNTIFVSGQHITEEFLRKTFKSCGNIINVSMEGEKNRGFVTFDKVESAKNAIAEYGGSYVQGGQLTVTYARRQPCIPPINDLSTSTVWSTAATNQSQKGPRKDIREPVTYDDDIFT